MRCSNAFHIFCAKEIEKEIRPKVCESFFGWVQCIIKSILIVAFDQEPHNCLQRWFFFCEHETFAITSSKVGLGEYSTYDLKTQGRWKQMLIQQDGDANATQQNENVV